MNLPFDEFLESMSKLNEEWSEDYIIPPSKSACKNAKDFNDILLSTDLDADRCKPSVNGGIGITFKNGVRKVYIEFDNNGSVYALKSDGRGEPIITKIAKEYQEYLRFIKDTINYLSTHENFKKVT